MFPKEEINAFCKGCHSKSRIPDPVKNKKAFKGRHPKDIEYCIQCHGDHGLGHRTRRWNKSTGELIQDDNVRMME